MIFINDFPRKTRLLEAGGKNCGKLALSEVHPVLQLAHLGLSGPFGPSPVDAVSAAVCPSIDRLLLARSFRKRIGSSPLQVLGAESAQSLLEDFSSRRTEDLRSRAREIEPGLQAFPEGHPCCVLSCASAPVNSFTINSHESPFSMAAQKN